jgi:hypothetical protein
MSRRSKSARKRERQRKRHAHRQQQEQLAKQTAVVRGLIGDIAEPRFSPLVEALRQQP